MERRPTGTGGAEFYNPAGADGAGEKGGAAVVALGGHSIRLSCCCNKSLLFAKASRVCVCAPSPLEGAGWQPRPGRGVGPPGAERAELAGRARAGPRGQVELPCGWARRAAMRCCRLYTFGNFRPWFAALRPPGTRPTALRSLGRPPGGPSGSFPGSGLPLPGALQTRPAAPGGLCAWASRSSWWAT